MVREGRGGGSRFSVFALIAIVVFLLSAGAAAGVFLYQRALVSKIADYNDRLVRAKNAFEIEFVDEVGTVARRIDAAKGILASHTALSPVFELLEQETLTTVRFTNFDFSFDSEGRGTITLDGEAAGFNALALQSDAFGEMEDLENPEFFDVSLDQSGNVSFTFSAGIRPELLSYRNTLSEESPPDSSSEPDGASPEREAASDGFDAGADVPIPDLDLGEDL
jgi:hypothetical protein